MAQEKTVRKMFCWPDEKDEVKKVLLYGTFSSPPWKMLIELPKFNNHFVMYISLPIGKYRYKFIVDNIPMCGKGQKVTDDEGHENNVLEINDTDQDDNDCPSPKPEEFQSRVPEYILEMPGSLPMYIKTFFVIEEVEEIVKKLKYNSLSLTTLLEHLKLASAVFFSRIEISQFDEFYLILQGTANEIKRIVKEKDFSHIRNEKEKLYKSIAKIINEAAMKKKVRRDQLENLLTQTKGYTQLIDDDSCKKKLEYLDREIKIHKECNNFEVKEIKILETSLNELKTLQDQVTKLELKVSKLREEEQKHLKFIYFLWDYTDLPCINKFFEDIKQKCPTIKQMSENVTIDKSKPNLLFWFIGVNTRMDHTALPLISKEWCQRVENSLVVRVHNEGSSTYEDDSMDTELHSYFLGNHKVLKAQFKTKFDVSGCSTESLQELLSSQQLRTQILSLIDEFQRSEKK